MNAKLMQLAAIVAVLLAPAAGETGRESGNVQHSCAPVFDAEVCTWAILESGSVVEIGATIPLSMVESVPADVEMTWPPQPLVTVGLPEAARSQLGIDHLVVNWEAHGHPPGAFLTPHFDFHFYSISREEVQAVDCADASKPSSPPAGFMLPDIEAPGLGMLHGLCVPQMGMHAMLEEQMAMDGPFEQAIIVGYYATKPVFIEPMVSRDRLLARSDFTLQVPQVEGLPTGVHYPREISAHYDPPEDRYRLVLRGFRNP